MKARLFWIPFSLLASALLLFGQVHTGTVVDNIPTSGGPLSVANGGNQRVWLTLQNRAVSIAAEQALAIFDWLKNGKKDRFAVEEDLVLIRKKEGLDLTLSPGNEPPVTATMEEGWLTRFGNALGSARMNSVEQGAP